METSQDRSPTEGAEAAREAGRQIADLVYEKQLAYGDASGIQHNIWKALLQQYLLPAGEAVSYHMENGSTMCLDPGRGAALYVMPEALMDHIPRLTRVFDRICRIVSNPATDRMGEDPWRDLAGDALCGIVMPRTRPEGGDPCVLRVSNEQGTFEVTGTMRKVVEPPAPPAVDWRQEGYPGEAVMHPVEIGDGFGEDPIETSAAQDADRKPAISDNPHPSQTRFWSEEEQDKAAEMVARTDAIRKEDEDLAAHRARREEIKRNGEVTVPPIRVTQQADADG